jgi:hypothetical protein
MNKSMYLWVDSVLLSAETRDLRRFVEAPLKTEKAFGDPQKWIPARGDGAVPAKAAERP